MTSIPPPPEDPTPEPSDVAASSDAPEELAALREELLQRFDELSRELRRQGRATLNAQAAAEACLKALQNSPTTPPTPPPTAVPAEGERWLRALLPVLDALERVASQAARIPPTLPAAEPPRTLFRRFFPAPAAPTLPPELAAVLRGLELLPPLIEQSLSLLGVTVERRVGVLVDATRHRVVETRGEEERPRVREVIRPGYWLGEVCVREADVVASKPRKN